jgi:AAA domain, putative AbiEii toxin, Type IV TA system/AAA ATPase domain
MLSSISISNFRTFRSETIPLKPITVFIGPNNSGKTNAIRAIQLLANAAGKGEWPNYTPLKPETVSFEVGAEAHFHATDLKLSFEGPRDTYWSGRSRLNITGEVNWSGYFPAREVKAPNEHPLNPRDAGAFVFEALSSARLMSPGIGQALSFFRDVRVASLSVPKLREPAALSMDPVLGERGENFGAVLDSINGKRPALFRAINDELKRVLGVDGCTTQVVADGKKIPAIIEGDQSFPADAVSDGVLLYLGLTTVAQLVGPGSLLIIEEPENGIHPRLLKALLEQIRAIGKTGTQIILTTHSPLLLDAFSEEPESVVVFDRDATGPTRVRQLTAAEMDPVLNGDFGLGSYWYSGAIGGVPR